jgi:hypothetical protein
MIYARNLLGFKPLAKATRFAVKQLAFVRGLFFCDRESNMKKILCITVVLLLSFQVLAADPPAASKTVPAPILNSVQPKFQLWTEDDAIGRLIGGRQWYVDPEQRWLYIAVSPAELRLNHLKLFKPGEKSNPWQAAQAAGWIKNTWLIPERFSEPLLLLRADKFELLKDEIVTVHDGKLPWQITQTESDDQLQLARQ